MIRKCDVELPEDFVRYYTGGWIGFRGDDKTIHPLCPTGNPNGTKIPVALMFPANGNPVGEFNGHKLQKVILDWEELKQQCDFGTPPVGMLEDESELIYTAVLAERHTNRGLRLDRLRFYDFTSFYLRNLTSRKTVYSMALVEGVTSKWDIVWKLFNRKFCTLKEAFNRLEEGLSVGEPITNNLGLFSLPDRRYPILAYKRWQMGYVPDPKTILLSPEFDDYQEELQEKYPDAYVRTI